MALESVASRGAVERADGSERSDMRRGGVGVWGKNETPPGKNEKMRLRGISERKISGKITKSLKRVQERESKRKRWANLMEREKRIKR